MIIKIHPIVAKAGLNITRMKMIAGFDPSLTHFGWVCFDDTKTGKDSVMEGGVFKTDPTDGLIIQRLLMQQERIRIFLSSRGIKFVSMEAPVWGDFNSELLFALNQFIHQVYLDLKVYVIQFPPTSLKKYAYPDKDPNEVTKHHMTHIAKTELGRHGKRFSEHVADAYFAGKIGLRYYKWLFKKELTDKDLSSHESEMFCGKHTYIRGAKKGITEYTGIIYKENEKFFDYTKKERDTKTIFKEIQDGGQSSYAGRVL
jgi:hypothetical protein